MYLPDSIVNAAVFFMFLFIAGCTPDDVGTGGTAGTVSAVDSLIRKEIEAGNIPGAVIQVKKGDSLLHRAAYGYARKYSYGLEPLENPEPMTKKHLFDLASLTKVMATTFGIMLLVDGDLLRLDDPLYKYLPEFEQGEKAKITIRHLLTHTAGLAQWMPVYYHVSGRQERYDYIASLPLKWEAGEERHYSDLGFMLLGEVIKRVTGRRLDKFLREELYVPLNLYHTVYNPLGKGFQKIAATSHGNPFERQMVYDNDFGYKVDVDPDSWDGWRRYTLQGEVNDGNAWYASGGVAGHAGLFSTVSDLQELVDLLINRGSTGGARLISAEVVDTFLTKDKYGNGLGWAMDEEFISAEGSPAGTFGHTGFTGTNITVVPRDSLSIILLTNRQNVGRQKNGYYYDLGPLRQAIFDEVMKASVP